MNILTSTILWQLGKLLSLKKIMWYDEKLLHSNLIDLVFSSKNKSNEESDEIKN